MSIAAVSEDVHGWDRTLLDSDIRSLCHDNPELIRPFIELGLDGASYTLHAGNQLWTAEYNADSGGVVLNGYQIELLQGSEYIGMKGFRIPPRRSAVIRTKESLHLAPNMIGRLTLRAGWAQRGLSYPGAIVDPGYFGYLFIAIDNGLDEYMEIPVQVEDAVDPKGKDGLIKMQLTQLHMDCQRPYSGREITELHPSRYPRTPQLAPYSPVQLRRLVDELSGQLKEINRQVRDNVDDIRRQFSLEKELTGSRVTSVTSELRFQLEAERDTFARQIQAEIAALKQSVDAEQKSLRAETITAFRTIEYGFFAAIAGIVAAVGSAAVNAVSRSAGQPIWVVAVIAILIFCAICIVFYFTRQTFRKREA